MDIPKFIENNHIDPEIQANPFTITSIKHASPEHYHDFYEFFLIIDGRCIHHVNGSQQFLKEGALVFMRPDDTHWYDYDGDSDCQFINVACTKNVIREVFNYLGETFNSEPLFGKLPAYTMLSPIETSSMTERCEKIKLLSTINKSQAKMQLKSTLTEIFTQYFSAIKTPDRKYIPLWFEVLLTQMQKKENFTLGLSKMYELSERSAGHLNRVFKEHLNTTPTAYINSLKLSFAKSLLLATDLSIIDISLECGFQNLSHFYHLFKRQFGLSPLDFRHTNKSI